MATSVISARGLTKAFGARLDDLSFQVSPGRVTGFLGPNGAGKTTTLRMLLGLARPTAGTATMLERPYTRLDHPARRVGVVLDTAVFHPPAKRPQPPALDGRGDRRGRQGPHRGGPGGRRPGAGGRPAGRGVLAWDAPAAGAGGGSTGELELLVLDEPANGLDPAGIRWLREFLRGFARSGGAVSVSSHLLGEIAQLADEVVVIRRGRLVAHTTVGALTTGSATTVRVRTPQADRLTGCWWRPVPRSKPVNRRPSECSAWAGAGRALAADARVVLHELVGETHSLEDVFLELTGEEAQDARVG